MTTTLLDQWQEQGHPALQRPVADPTAWCLAAALFALQNGSGWRPNSVAAFDVTLVSDGQTRCLRVDTGRGGRAQVSGSEGMRDIGLPDGLSACSAPLRGQFRYEVQGVTRQAIVAMVGAVMHLYVNGSSFVFAEGSAFPDTRSALDPRRCVAPVAGRVTQVRAAVGATVQEGDPLVCIEAMKMEMWVSAGTAGQVAAVNAVVGDQIELGSLLVELKPPV